VKGDGGKEKGKDGRAGQEISLPAAAAPSPDPSSPIADYLTHLEKERDVSPNTVIAYRRDLEEFVAFLGAYYGAREWSWQGLDRLAIRGFLAHLTRKKLNKRSIARALSAVRSFYKYLHRNELVDANPARAPILAALDALVAKAQANGSAIGVISALPISIQTVADWATTLQTHNVTLVPVSTLMK